MKYLSTNELVAGKEPRQTEKFSQLREAGVTPHLAIVRDERGAGRPDIRSYTAAARRHVARSIGAAIPVEWLVSVHTKGAQDIKSVVEDLSVDDKVHGLLVMSPTVEDYDDIAAAIDPRKDIDRMNPDTREWLARQGKSPSPATPQAVQESLAHHGLWTPDYTYTLVGRGRTVGSFVDEGLKDLHGSAYDEKVHVITGSNSHELPDAISCSEVVIVAAGVRNQITADMVHPWLMAVTGVCIGDIDESVYRYEGNLLVTPRHNDENYWGIGANTSAIAWENTLEAAALQNGVLLTPEPSVRS